MTTAQRFMPGRAWKGPAAGQRFAHRSDGYRTSRKVWVCLSCRAWLEPRPRADGSRSGKPASCSGCGGKDYLYFDSAIEARRFVRLWTMQDAHEIRGLRHHPRFDLYTVDPGDMLVKVGVYEADSEYWAGEEHIVEDVKPASEAAQDPVFRWKRRHFEAQFGIRIRIVSKV